MKIRHNSGHHDENREFGIILTGSFVFYLLLISLVNIIPVDLNRSFLKSSTYPRKITMVFPLVQPVSKPAPLPQVPELKRTKPVTPIIPKKTKTTPLTSSPKEKDIEEQKRQVLLQPSQEELGRKKQEELKLQKQKEFQKNKEVATNKFASLFGNGTEDLLTNKELNVISITKPSVNTSNGEGARTNNPDNLEVSIKNQEADRILKELASGHEKQNTPLLGEHETKRFGSTKEIENIGNVRSSEDFEKSFKAYEGRLKSFYDKTIQTETALKGIMVIRITLSPDGKVIKCEILSSTLNNKKFENEIAKMIQEQFQFSKISQGEEFYNKSLKFHPEN